MLLNGREVVTNLQWSAIKAAMLREFPNLSRDQIASAKAKIRRRL